MHSELPIACSLDAEELTERLAQIGAIGREALIDVDACPGGAVLRFAPSEPIRERLEAIVAAEARCCAFLRFALHDEPEAIALSVQAPDGAEPVVDDLVAAFSDSGAIA